MSALVYVDIDQGINEGITKVARNERRKKLCGFSFSINIANFEAFLSVFKLTKNLLFMKSVKAAKIILRINNNFNIIIESFSLDVSDLFPLVMCTVYCTI